MRRKASVPSAWQRRLLEKLPVHKYSLTLIIILLAHIALVGLEREHFLLLGPLLTLALYFLGFLLLQDRSRMSRAMLAVGCGALALSLVNMFVGGAYCLAAALTGHAIFLLLLVIFLFRHLLAEKRVTLDQVMAGIIIYLLIAGLWTQFYALTLLVNPDAVHIAGGLGECPFLTMYYFSVTTLTTAGFGDIVPVSDLARILAAYESLVGQVYLVVFIALLMGRHFASK